MSFELFEKERRVIEGTKEVLQSGELDPAAEKALTALSKEYQKLFKTTQRLVKMSDRNEAQLNNVAKSLDEKTRTLEELSGKLAKYLSPQVFDSIFLGQQDVELRTVRKKLTIFFSDLKDFTEITEESQPEDLTFLLNSYFKEMSQIALAHGATIDKFIGDAMLMFFGDPQSRGVEEDARACIRMAIDMQRRMKDLAQDWRALGFSRPFEMRIGVHTGFCNVGNFGSDERMDYTIIGGAVNLAARLESLCDPGGILVSYETRALAGDMVDAEERGEVHCKGIRKPVDAYSILGIHENNAADQQEGDMRMEGFALRYDPKRLSNSDRAEALAALDRAKRALLHTGGSK